MHQENIVTIKMYSSFGSTSSSLTRSIINFMEY